jgi:2-polyprenyl-3-methyl-5-hydroxy-6-metoxy-1,4-benzoquinol methylase
MSEPTADRDNWTAPYEVLRKRWHRVPAGGSFQILTGDMLCMTDVELMRVWQASFDRASVGPGYNIRGWYHDLYRERLAGKKCLDVGCGMALSTLHFAEHGARFTFSDIVRDNVRLVKRLSAIKGIEADFMFIEDARSFDGLPNDFDVVVALGSLINAPTPVIREEIQSILPHLKPGGRWLHFAYPKARWQRDGSPPFSEWGLKTDGEGTPWMEYHNRQEIEFLFSPYQVEIVFDCEWHNSDFNWFDLTIHPPK